MTQKDGDDAFSVVMDEPSGLTKNEISSPNRAAPARVDVGDGAVMMQSQVLQSKGPAPDAKTKVAVDNSATVPLGEPAQQPRGGLGKLGRYTMLSRLGKGGMAEVFLATQDGPAGFQKQVVIKKSDPELAKNPRFVEMFLREAKIAALLNHTNVVQVFELGQEGDAYFIAMEHIDGISLHKAARRAWSIGESIPMEVVVKCVADAARGLHYAHTWKDRQGNLQGFIHRDISPDNLMVTRDGVTKVLDFGIAKMAIDDAEPVTKTGEIKGKIPYMSPEQLKGEVLDGRADLWSLGVTLYWLLTGARPFAGGNEIATLQAILHEQPLPPRQVNPLVPIPLERLTMRLLEKDRNKRFSSGAEVADALMTLLGPGAGSNATSDFALKMLALEDADGGQIRTSNPGSQSVQTVVAAKPQTEWLMKQAPVDTGEAAEWRGTITGSSRPDLSAPQAQNQLQTPVSSADAGFADQTTQLPAGAQPTPSSKGPIIGVAVAGVFVMVAAIAIVVLNQSEDPKPPTPPIALVTPPVTPPPVTPPVTTPPPVTTTTPPVTTTTPPVTTTTPPVTTTTPPEPPVTTPPPVDGPPDGRRPPHDRGNPNAAGNNPNLQKVASSAPDNIRWESMRGRPVGKGNSGFPLPADMQNAVAVDPVTGGRTVVPIVGGKVDYNALGKGRLAVRAQPYAEVKLGSKNLGSTPFDPLNLVVGEYVAVLNYEGKIVERPFTITAGKETVVAVNMLK